MIDFKLFPDEKKIVLSISGDTEFWSFWSTLRNFLQRCIIDKKKCALGTWDCSRCPFEVPCENDNTAEPHYKNFHKKNFP